MNTTNDSNNGENKQVYMTIEEYNNMYIQEDATNDANMSGCCKHCEIRNLYMRPCISCSKMTCLSGNCSYLPFYKVFNACMCRCCYENKNMKLLVEMLRGKNDEEISKLVKMSRVRTD